MNRPLFTTPMHRLQARLHERRWAAYSRPGTPSIFLRWQPGREAPR